MSILGHVYVYVCIYIYIYIYIHIYPFIDICGHTVMKTGRFELVLETHLQKQAFLDLPRHSRDREEGLDHDCVCDYPPRFRAAL